MKFFSSQLLSVVLLGATAVSATSVLTRRGAGVSSLDLCPTAQIVQTQVIQVGANSVTRTTYACPNKSLRKTPGSKRGAAKRTFSGPFGAFEKRNAVECRTAAPECQCGQDFTCECQDVTAQAPVPSDCTTLAETTAILAQTGGPTFLVQPDNFELISSGTCALEFTNESAMTLEYCWDELGSTGTLVNQECFENGAGTAAACDANDGDFLTQSLRVGS
ncbi:hypothetical protein SCHPADRAFT_887449 [Schizopora paradoxa]|uniref:Uncharacterized protein n=1 Tax=Schizopora paradoxa TaxID=27342 RepID=A0A0H2RXM1_9AGAM|nr:hypothetical protein SCHPADRAFT_887449 [Schizopora paradoxa]